MARRASQTRRSGDIVMIEKQAAKARRVFAHWIAALNRRDRIEFELEDAHHPASPERRRVLEPRLIATCSQRQRLVEQLDVLVPLREGSTTPTPTQRALW